jgi:hypothetical protein
MNYEDNHRHSVDLDSDSANISNVQYNGVIQHQYDSAVEEEIEYYE